MTFFHTCSHTLQVGGRKQKSESSKNPFVRYLSYACETHSSSTEAKDNRKFTFFFFFYQFYHFFSMID